MIRHIYCKHLNRIIFILFFLIFLQSCSYQQKISNAIKTHTKKVMKVMYRDKDEIDYIIAFYNLVEYGNLYKNYLFADYYPSLINNDHFLNEYSKIMNEKVFLLSNIEEVANDKIIFFLDLIKKLTKKYPTISGIPFSLRLRLKFNKSNKLDHLVLLDEYYSNLPLLVPEYNANISSFFGTRCMNYKTKIQTISNKKFKKKKSEYQYIAKKLCKMHYGIDLQSKEHDIYAAGGALVEDVRRDSDFGNNIILNHGWNIKTRYAHLSAMNVKKGDYVVRGEKIGTQGCTGRSSGPHLHFEIIVDKKRINPEEFINFREVCK